MRSLPPVLVLACGCLCSLPAAAQPAKPTLELRTATGQTIFHIGARISLALTLTGPDNKKYSIDTATYDRSGRLEIDTFSVSPESGWADPLAKYFSQGTFMGGGLRGSDVLSPRPVRFTEDRNEQVRFDQPGAYTITATTHRIGTKGKDLFPREPYLALASNPVRIQIIPATPEWQSEKLEQFPAGTRFTLVPAKPRTGEQLKLEHEAEALFQKHGMILDQPAPTTAH